jgi:hypothetical protein
MTVNSLKTKEEESQQCQSESRCSFFVSNTCWFQSTQHCADVAFLFLTPAGFKAHSIVSHRVVFPQATTESRF